MIEKAFQDAIVYWLGRIPFFRTDYKGYPEVQIFIESDDDVELADADAETRIKRINDRVDEVGFAGLLMEPDTSIVQDSPDMERIECALVFLENRTQNRNQTTGCRRSVKDAKYWVKRALNRYNMPFNDAAGERVYPFKPLKIERGDYILDAESKLALPSVIIRSEYVLPRIVPWLADENDLFIVDENGNPIEVEE